MTTDATTPGLKIPAVRDKVISDAVISDAVISDAVTSDAVITDGAISDRAIASPTSHPDPVIRVTGLTKKFNSQEGVEDLTFEIPPGVIFGFIGPSGSGKTTTVRLLTGIYQPTAGQAVVLGQSPKKFSAATRRRLGYLPQDFVLYPNLSVWENLNFAASLYGLGLWRGRRLKQLLEFVELQNHRHKLARDLSGGMRRRLALASTLTHDPDLLFLDEPTAGIDPILRRKFWDYFKDLQSKGRTLFVTTQYLGEAAYCDLIGVMAEGRLLMVETPEGLRHRALGGEVVDMRLQGRPDYALVSQLRELPFTHRRVMWLNDTTLRLIVDDASTTMPALLEWCATHNQTVDSIEEYLPPLDDVFVELMKKNQE
jgi:ABC-2 type transport system ATP-binding protein